MSRESVFKLISRRVRSGSMPRKRKDKFRVALVIEGGAMRSVISAGATAALLATKAIDAIDDIYTVSAASSIGAYAISGQASGVKIYWEEGSQIYSMNPFRVLNGGSIFDFSHAHKVMDKKHPLDFKRFKKKGINLHVYAASAEDGTLVVKNEFKNRKQLLKSMSFAMGVPYMTPLHKDGKKHFADAGFITGGLLLEQALQGGATHVLVVRSSKSKEIKKNWGEAVYAKMLEYRFPKLAKAYNTASHKHNQALNRINNSEGNLAAIDIIGSQVSVGRAEKRSHVLMAGARAGYNATLKKFSELPVTQNIF